MYSHTSLFLNIHYLNIYFHVYLKDNDLQNQLKTLNLQPSQGASDSHKGSKLFICFSFS